MSRQMLRALFVALAVAPASALAQADKDLAAWVALSYSTPGAFAPDLPQGRILGAGRMPTIRARLGSREYGANATATFYGFGLESSIGGTAMRLDFLGSSVDECDACSSYGFSFSAAFPVYTPSRKDVSGIEVSLIPGLGVSSANEDEITMVTATVEVPVNLRINLGGLVVRPFFSPGYGFGSYDEVDFSESGTLPFYGYGIAIGSARWEASVGQKQVVLENAPSVLGLSLALRF